MRAPVIWIFAPVVVAVGLVFLARFRRTSLAIAMAVLLVLAGLVNWLPFNETIKLGPLIFRFNDTLPILGRHFTLISAERSIVVLIYMTTAFLLGGALAVKVHSLFPSLALVITALLVAALSVEPFLYAALLIEMAVLVCIPMLVSPGEPPKQGVMRFLIFQTLAMPFILFTGWMLTGIETGSASATLAVRAGILLGLGFALFLAVFPFYSWVPLIAEQNSPYLVGFIIILLPTAILLFGADFINRYAWLRESTAIQATLRFTGLMMMITSGGWAATEKHLGRMFGYAAILETGVFLLALSLGTPSGLSVFSMLFLPRAIGLGVWALCLALLLERTGSLEFTKLAGYGKKDPILAGCLLLAGLSVAGLPMLAGFPVRLILWEKLIKQSIPAAALGLAGLLSLLIGILRTVVNLFDGDGWAVDRHLPWGQYSLVLIGCLMIILIGLEPQWFFLKFIDIAKAYGTLVP